MENKFYLYFLRRPDKVDLLNPCKGQPFYIGKGYNDRIKEHRKEAERLRHKPGKKSHKINIIHKLWKQGLDFEEDIYLDSLSEDDAFALEIAAIEQYGRKDNKTGVLTNLTNGGEGSSGIIITDEWRKNLSLARTGLIFSEDHKANISKAKLGKKPSIESIEKMKESLTGRNLSEEHKRNIGNSGKGKKRNEKSKQKMREIKLGQNNPNYGKKHPLEVKEKMSETQKAIWKKRKEAGWISPLIGRSCPKETREKISKTLKGRKGRPCTDEQKEKQRQSMKGRAKTEEHKRNLSKSAKGRPSQNKGIPRTEECKEKIRTTKRRTKIIKNILLDWQEYRKKLC